MCETRLTDLLNILVDRMIEEAGNHHGPVIEELLHLGFTKIPRECPLRKGWDESGWVS